MLIHFFFAVKVFIHSVVSQFGWIQYPSVFLSEHDPELAEGKCESKLSRLAGVCRGPRDARFSRTGVGIRRRNPERSRGSPLTLAQDDRRKDCRYPLTETLPILVQG